MSRQDSLLIYNITIQDTAIIRNVNDQKQRRIYEFKKGL